MMESTSELQKIIDKCAKMEEALKKIINYREAHNLDNNPDGCRDDITDAFYDCEGIAIQAIS